MQELLNYQAISLEYEMVPGDPYSQMTGSTLPNTQSYVNANTPQASQGMYEGGSNGDSNQI